MTTLSQQQGEAVKTVVSRLKVNNPQPVTYLAGYAGTGKSTILPHIIADLGLSPDSVQFVAPTGKAAKVMRNKLRKLYPGCTAGTIHSMIYRAKPAPIAKLEADLVTLEMELEEAIREGASRDDQAKRMKMIKRLKLELSECYREDKLHFQLNPDSSIAMARLIVVDEASMVGLDTTEDLMSFGVPILAMGDPGQLPPIEQKPGLTAGKPDYFLTEVHRQAHDNPILHLATLAREGKDLPRKKYGDGVEVLYRRDFDPAYNLEDCPKFLCGTNKTRWKVNQMLREEFGFVEKMGDKVGPQEGEPLIVTKNHKEYPEIPNGSECTALSSAELHSGDTAFTLSFSDEDGVPYIGRRVFQGEFECHFSRKKGGYSAPESSAFRAKKATLNMDWAFCITVHKSQGSEWDDVVVIDESSVFKEDCDKHLYTAITRAAKTLKVLI